MMASFSHWMEIALWIVMGSMAVDFLIGLFRMLKSGKLSHEPMLGYLKDMLHFVLPLFLLANIATMDETGWIVQVGYYLGALAVLVKYLTDIKAKL